jgi:hypothetical protein
MAKKKEIEVIDRGGAKTVAKKTSVVTHAKRIFLIVSVIWLAFVAWFPLHVKNKYSDSIKQSTVVAIFYDLQRNVAEQYERMLNGIKNAINLEKPVSIAIDKVKMVESKVDKVTDATAKAKEQTEKVKEQTSGVRALTGLANKFGVKTGAVDNALNKADGMVDKANATVDKVDNVAKLVNDKLDGVEKELTKVTQLEVDKVIDAAIKSQMDSAVAMLFTKYDIKHVYPWEPSSWPTARKIYRELVNSNLDFVHTIIKTVNNYFGYVAWGLVFAAWLLGLYIWTFIHGKYKATIAPFIVCPRCGHAFADKRTAMSMLKLLQPWKWF